MKTDVLIVGAGMAGLTLADRLARRGISALIVEQGLFPGGHAAALSCKAITSCAKCNACLLEETMTDLSQVSGPELACRTRSVSVRNEARRYQVRLITEPLYLDPNKCVDCGLCLEACPADKAVRRSPLPFYGPAYSLDPSECLTLQGQDCQACLDVCPVEAIDFNRTGREEEVEVGAVVVAAGFEPFDPRLKPRFGYGRLADVITGLDLEAMLRKEGRLTRPSDGQPPENVAFVQCVGSRDRLLGKEYCSRVCCGYALRLGQLIRHRWPETQVSFFYMDVQTFGRNFDSVFEQTRQEVELIHGIPGEIAGGSDDKLTVPFMNEDTGLREAREFDLVVLSIGLGAPGGDLDQVLGLTRDEDGFLIGKPEEGLFVTGAATGPLNVAEVRTQVEGAAVDVAAYLKKHNRN